MVRVTKDLIDKTTIVDNDKFTISDSADLNDGGDAESGKLKRLSWVNLKTSISSYYNALTATITNKTIDLSSNTVTTTKAQLDTAVSDGDVVYTNDTSVLSNSWVLDEDNMVSDSNTKVPTQQSTKAYVDANIGLDITGLTEESSIVSGDFVPFYDTSAGANRKIDASILENKFETVVATRAANATDAVVSYTHSMGVIPKYITVTSFHGGGTSSGAMSSGSWDGTNNSCSYTLGDGFGSGAISSIFSILISVSAGSTQQRGVIENVSSTGFDVDWTRINSTASTTLGAITFHLHY